MKTCSDCLNYVTCGSPLGRYCSSDVEKWCNAFVDKSKDRDEALEEIGRRIKQYEKQLDAKCDRSIARDRAEAIKEFVERLERRILPQLTCSTLEKKEAYCFCLDEIDNLVKEMTEKDNG